MHERIAGCIQIENAAADIYSSFMRMFPAERDFWDGLFQDEIRHSTILSDAEVFGVFGEVDGELSPPAIPYISRTLAFAEKVRERIRSGPILLEEALRMALTLEESMAEGFIYDVMERMGAETPDGFTLILSEEKAHVDKLRDFMEKRGMLKVS